MAGDGSTSDATSARWRRWLFLVLCAAAPLVACSVLLDTTKPQCSVDADCDAHGAAFAGSVCIASFCQAPATMEASAPDAGSIVDAGADVDPLLGCVGVTAAPMPKTPAVKLDILLHDFLQPQKPVTDVQARLCPNAGDPLCKGGTTPIAPGADGHVKFDLDVSKGAFTGYIAVDPATPDAGGSDAAAPEAYMPTRIAYTSQPIAVDLVDDWLMATPSTLSTFTSLYNLSPLDPKLGFVILVVKSCKNVELPGATVTPDLTSATSLGFYFIDGSPSTTAKVTDSSGYFGFLNSPTGARTFTASYGNEHLGSLTTYAYPNTITVGPLGPDFKR